MQLNFTKHKLLAGPASYSTEFDQLKSPAEERPCQNPMPASRSILRILVNSIVYNKNRNINSDHWLNV